MFSTNHVAGLVFCRLYINCESADTHKLAFNEVERLVKLDTGSGLCWWHLDATSTGDLSGTIIQWTSDQGGRQVKGMSLSYSICLLHSLRPRSPYSRPSLETSSQVRPARTTATHLGAWGIQTP